MTEFQEGRKGRQELEKEKAVRELVNAFEVFINTKKEWRRQLTFAASFPDHRLRQARVYLEVVLEAGGEVFIIDETPKNSTGIILLKANEYSQLYTPKLSKRPETKPKFAIHYGPVSAKLRNLKGLDIYQVLQGKPYQLKGEELKKKVDGVAKEGKRGHSIVSEIRLRSRLRKRIISDLGSIGITGKFWIISKHQNEYHPVLGNAEGEWGLSKALLRREL